MRSILRALNAALLEHRRERLAQRPQGYCIAVARVDAEQTGLVVVEVEEVEADATISDRGNRELTAAMGQRLQITMRKVDGWQTLTHKPTDLAA